VKVEIYTPDGRRVKTFAEREMSAGPQAIHWTVDRALPSGMYFYKVLAGEHVATGKVARVN